MDKSNICARLYPNLKQLQREQVYVRVTDVRSTVLQYMQVNSLEAALEQGRTYQDLMTLVGDQGPASCSPYQCSLPCCPASQC
jgi:hypothetical protein